MTYFKRSFSVEQHRHHTPQKKVQKRTNVAKPTVTSHAKVTSPLKTSSHNIPTKKVVSTSLQKPLKPVESSDVDKMLSSYQKAQIGTFSFRSILFSIFMFISSDFVLNVVQHSTASRAYGLAAVFGKVIILPCLSYKYQYFQCSTVERRKQISLKMYRNSSSKRFL